MIHSLVVIGRLLRRAGLLLLALPVTTYSLYAQNDAQDPPLISIGVCVDAPLYKDNIPSHVTPIEEEVARGLADHYDKIIQFGYLRWAAGTCQQPAMGAAAALTIHLVQVPQAFGSEIRLEYRFKGQSLASVGPELFYPRLFEWYDDPYTHNPRALTREILNALKQSANSDTFQQNLGPVLQSIPLSSTITLGSAPNRLIVPLRSDLLQAKPIDTTLRAEFTDAGMIAGNMRMRLEGAYPAGVENVLQCMLTDFSYLNHIYSTPERINANWTSLEDVLTEPNLRGVTIYMHQYSPDFFPGADLYSGLVSDP